MDAKKLILVVDDDPDIRDSLKVILESSGYSVTTATNGEEAQLALQSRRPDLMILDVMMTTDTEGFEFAYALRDDQKHKDIPVILLTSFLEKVHEEGPENFQHILGEKWPARWLFEKPVPAEKLLAKIEAILQGK